MLFFSPLIPSHLFFFSFFFSRYAIDDSSADWSLAEAQLANNLKGGSGINGVSTVVSVKATTPSGQKRKFEEPVDGGGGKDKKKPTRRGLKKVKH